MNSHNTQRSSSSCWRAWKYDVFLSFRGEDTCNYFAVHLCAALHEENIFIFKDGKRLRKGDNISQKLLNAIEESRISIVVFSKNYAHSIGCLEELAKISELINEPGYTVIPIFYDVDPCEVRKQSKGFEKAFAEHEERFRFNLEKVQRWRLALTQVANITGFDVRNKSKSEVIDDIVEVTITKLGQKVSALADNLVGIQSRLEALDYLLDLDSEHDDAVRFVGICGMVGSGKTTLAAAAYDKIYHRFDSCCFLDNVRDHCKGLGLIYLQQELLRQILNENMKIEDDDAGTNLISTRLSHLKTLIVVDDVDDSEQLQKLVGNSDSKWFGGGSRLIITTRDERVLRDHGVDRIYKVQLLNDDESLQLLCMNAFNCDNPSPDFQELTHAILEPAKGLPLAIVYFGSLLCGRSALNWKIVLDRMKIHPPRGLMDALRTSFDSLEEEEKEIFLDVACFFKGAKENDVMEILGYCGFHVEVGVRALLDKSLVSIVNGTFWMHDLMQILGCCIVRRGYPYDPTKWSRLWLYRDFEHVVWSYKMVPNLRGVDLRNTEKMRMMMPDFIRMPNLEMLNLEGCSGLLQLPPSVATLPKLKYLNLKNCINLISIPNSLFGLSSLRFLNLAGCSKLAECLDFDSWRSSIEVKVTSNEDVTLLEVFSYNTLISFPEKIKNNKFVYDCLSCLMDND